MIQGQSAQGGGGWWFSDKGVGGEVGGWQAMATLDSSIWSMFSG